MITVHPNPLPIWDDLPEKVVQAAITRKLVPAFWQREYPIGSGYLDLLGEYHAIEIKRSTSSYPAYSTVGQVNYYLTGLELDGRSRAGIILLYGSNFDRYLDPIITEMRLARDIRIWVAISLADGVLLDIDSEQIITLADLDR
jgi:hypothetical protein